jgi:hypothetical protein
MIGDLQRRGNVAMGILPDAGQIPACVQIRIVSELEGSTAKRRVLASSRKSNVAIWMEGNEVIS